ncbi:type II secretion system protein [Desulfovibrio inopinatus]|uniref:type II secretion system protein n=1 Tax=Desulfovibrio inopinatus TaxID=102109 RepID=UPI00040ED910|nr:type II secretion system protein [Desulfovibrio inopinatus]
MKTTNRPIPQTGFTLLEIILTLVILGIAATTIVPFMGWKLMRSGDVESRLETDVALNQVMERMVAHYTDLMSSCSSLATCKARLDELYGGSDSTDDIGSAGSTVSSGDYGTYYVQENKYVDYDKNTNTFVNGGTSSLYLLVIIKPDAASQLSLTYLFSAYAGGGASDES